MSSLSTPIISDRFNCRLPNTFFRSHPCMPGFSARMILQADRYKIETDMLRTIIIVRSRWWEGYLNEPEANVFHVSSMLLISSTVKRLAANSRCSSPRGPPRSIMVQTSIPKELIWDIEGTEIINVLSNSIQSYFAAHAKLTSS